tara:strand:+ start:303 stop:419 length:117 start_codon:yes stop_codon:yes gene_type:complete
MNDPDPELLFQIKKIRPTDPNTYKKIFLAKRKLRSSGS